MLLTYAAYFQQLHHQAAQFYYIITPDKRSQPVCP